MFGRIHVNNVIDVIYRFRSNQSQRLIARETGISRTTVRKYFSLAEKKGWLSPDSPLPSIEEIGKAIFASEIQIKCDYPLSPLAPYEKQISGWMEKKYTKKRMRILLAENHDVKISYTAIKRYCSRLKINSLNKETIRIETAPGVIAQIDFGEVTRNYVNVPKGVRIWVFIMTLGNSRHMYVEHVFNQKSETWLSCFEKAFAFFGGVVSTVVIDNLKAAVKKILYLDPILSEPFKRLARHYGFMISPCRVRTPEHKGKVESNVKYVQKSLCDGAFWTNLSEMNQRALTWVVEEAGTRIHGTIKKQPMKVFNEIEKSCLSKLPATPFNYTTASRQKLLKDIHILFKDNWYSAPHGYIGDYLDIYASGGLIKIYESHNLIATHTLSTKTGDRITNWDHYSAKKRWWLEQTPMVCTKKAAKIGKYCYKVVAELLADNVQDRKNSVNRLLSLKGKYGETRLENACERAVYYQSISYIKVKMILSNETDLVDIEPNSGLIPTKTTGYDNAKNIGECV